MMLDWDGYRQELLGRIGDLGRVTPQTVRGYRELSDAGNKTAHLDAKTRELIAIAVGVTRQCDGCITTHVHAAKKQGATKPVNEDGSRTPSADFPSLPTCGGGSNRHTNAENSCAALLIHRMGFILNLLAE
jgi:AhpD family alkylhydroperoxidase